MDRFTKDLMNAPGKQILKEFISKYSNTNIENQDVSIEITGGTDITDGTITYSKVTDGNHIRYIIFSSLGKTFIHSQISIDKQERTDKISAETADQILAEIEKKISEYNQIQGKTESTVGVAIEDVVQNFQKNEVGTDISETGLLKLIKDYGESKTEDGWIEKKDELILSQQIINRIEAKEKTCTPVEIDFDQLAIIQAKRYTSRQQDIVVIRNTTDGQRYLLNSYIFHEKPRRAKEQYQIDIVNDFVILPNKPRDREMAQRTFEVTIGTKFIVGDRVYTIVIPKSDFGKIDGALTKGNGRYVKGKLLEEHVQNFNRKLESSLDSNPDREETQEYETQQAVEDVAENLESKYPENLERDIREYIGINDRINSDPENKANLESDLMRIENDILDNICIIIKNALEKGLTIPQFDDICIASEGFVDAGIRCYLPEERFYEDGKVKGIYRSIFVPSPQSGYSLYIKIINRLDNNR